MSDPVAGDKKDQEESPIPDESPAPGKPEEPDKPEEARAAVAFASGVAPAADPGPSTVMARADQPYGDPVDPWAGHAAGFNTPVDGHYAYPPEKPAARKPRRRTWLVVLLASLMTVVLAVATAAIVYFWPRYPALDFERLTEGQHFSPVVPVSSAWSDATVSGDRIYFASSDTKGAVGVTAIDGHSPQPFWSSTAAGTAKRWTGMMALPWGVMITGTTGVKATPKRTVVLGSEQGQLLWDILLGTDDQMIYGKDVAVHVDVAGHQLIGLDAATGSELWRLPDLSDTGTRTLPISAPEDLTGPSSGRGRPFSPAFTDQRLVQINADHSVRLVDMSSGTVGKSWQTGAVADDEVYAHNGQLIIRESGNVQRVVAYDLTTGSPNLLYTAEPDTELTGLAPCGDDLVCFVKTVGGAKEQTVVRLSLTGAAAWESAALTGIIRVFPIGNTVIVQSETNTTLLDDKGATSWTHPGSVARIDSGNMLRFGHIFTEKPIDESLSGQHVGDAPVELGAAYDVRTETCAWTARVLGCVTEKDYVTQRFAK
ncbi:hypothetical protein ACQP2E_11685 [Actinoplanes sp. CA-015351]|uniref:hypothetical protein n=1 Tax=Actinoplanes sp. CA-015351 TaxID=3239897 RepID=UPI003D996298